MKVKEWVWARVGLVGVVGICLLLLLEGWGCAGAGWAGGDTGGDQSGKGLF